MKNLSYFLLLSLMILFSSCATVIEGESSDYGPNNSGNSKEGVVAYNPTGLQNLVDLRRNDALKKIYTLCGNSKDYTIVKEEDKTPANKDKLTNDLATLGADKLRYVHYRCNK